MHHFMHRNLLLKTLKLKGDKYVLLHNILSTWTLLRTSGSRGSFPMFLCSNEMRLVTVESCYWVTEEWAKGRFRERKEGTEVLPFCEGAKDWTLRVYLYTRSPIPALWHIPPANKILHLFTACWLFRSESFTVDQLFVINITGMPLELLWTLYVGVRWHICCERPGNHGVILHAGNYSNCLF